MRPKSSATKEDNISLSRFLLCWSFECFSHRAVCLLHRRFLASSRSDPRFAYSRKACIESAIALLNSQEVLHTNWHPSQNPMQYRLFFDDVVGSDFIMAATILALDVVCTKKYSQSEANAAQGEMILTEEAILKLQRSYDIWYETREVAPTSRKSSTILASLLGHLGHYPSKETTPMSPSWPALAPKNDTYQMAQAPTPESSHTLQPQTQSAQNAPLAPDPTTCTLYPTLHVYSGAESSTPTTVLSPDSAQYQVSQQPLYYDPTNYENIAVPLPSNETLGNSSPGVQVNPFYNFISNLQSQDAPAVLSEEDQGFDWVGCLFSSTTTTNTCFACQGRELTSSSGAMGLLLALKFRQQYEHEAEPNARGSCSPIPGIPSVAVPVSISATSSSSSSLCRETRRWPLQRVLLHRRKWQHSALTVMTDFFLKKPHDFFI